MGLDDGQGKPAIGQQVAVDGRTSRKRIGIHGPTDDWSKPCMAGNEKPAA
jgi:hypothetical protein